MAATSILASIEAGLLAFNNLAEGVKTIAAEFKRANDNAWWQKEAATFKPMEQNTPSTPEQADEAAKSAAELIHGL